MAEVTVFHEHGFDCLTPWVVKAERKEIAFEDAAAALEEFAAEVAVILCDRDVDRALWLLHMIKTRFPATPVVFITAMSSEEVVTQAFKGGARDYFRIPFDRRLLANSLERILEFKRWERKAGGMPPPGGSGGGHPGRPLPDGIARAISGLPQMNFSGFSIDASISPRPTTARSLPTRWLQRRAAPSR